MTDSLPVVPKAQPIWVCLTCGTDGEEPAENCKQNSIQVAHYSAVQEERSSWEKREQTLKNKIKEIESVLRLTTIVSVKVGDNTSPNLARKYYEICDELLGLSKQ